MKIKPISRRQFVKGTGALIVSFHFYGPVSRLLAQSESLSTAAPEATSLDSWLAVAQDGSVTVFTSKGELGTGVETALAQIVAEELDVPFSRIKMDAGDTARTIDQSVTAASRTIERGGPQLRQAAAAGRQELLSIAYTIVCTSVPRVDLPPKFTGEFTYTPDVRVPGMLHGRVIRPAVVNSKPSSVDESSIAHIPGVVKVVQQGGFLGVVAQTEWAAIQAAKALKVTWSSPTTKLPATADAVDAYLTDTKPVRELTPV